MHGGHLPKEFFAKIVKSTSVFSNELSSSWIPFAKFKWRESVAKVTRYDVIKSMRLRNDVFVTTLLVK